jgi:hypothetical protein
MDLAHQSRKGVLVHCEDLESLKRDYKRSLLVWAQYAFPLPGDLVQSPQQVAELKYQAQQARIMAAMHMAAHQQSCPFCKAASSDSSSVGRSHVTR